MNRKHPTSANPWRLSALAAAGALMTGCAALQIDVDVYKGPLVHDEETQVQQLASIAMSGKAVMLLKRNSWLNTLNPHWAGGIASGKTLRTRHITKREWEQLGLRCASDTNVALCRNTRLINDMLSAYEDRIEPGLAEPMDAVAQRYDDYKLARSRYARAQKKADAEKDKPGITVVQRRANAEKATQALTAADEGLRQTWGALVDLLYEAKRRMPRGDDSAYKAVERQSAEILAQLTDPAYLLCAAPTLPAGVELTRVLKPMTEALNGADDEAREAGAQRAVRMFNGALRLATPDEIFNLRRAMTASVTLINGKCPSGTDTRDASTKTLAPRYVNKQAQTALEMAPATGVQGAAAVPAMGNVVIVRKGVHREATGGKYQLNALDKDQLRPVDEVVQEIDDLWGAPNEGRLDALDEGLQEIDDLWGALNQFGASGFDRGRPRLGLDRLADEAAAERFDRRGRGRGADKALADSPQTKQLQDSAVDLASRMQFLAVNMRLVDGTSSDTEAAFKSTLETIANTLLVLTEDQRRQGQHRVHQKDIADAEYAAAVDAFKIDSGRRFDQLTAWLTTRLAKVRAEESKDTANTQKKTALATLQASTREELKGAEETVTSRSTALQDLVALLVSLDGAQPKDLANLTDATQETVKAKSKDTAAKWKADKAALEIVLKAVAPKTTVQTLRDAVASWLTSEVQEQKSPANIADPRQLRLQAAKAALESFKTAGVKEMARPDALKSMRLDLSAAWDRQRAALIESEDNVGAARKKLSEIETELKELDRATKTRLLAEGAGATGSAEIEGALKLLRALRASVVADATTNKGAHDVNTIRELVNAKLEQGKNAAAADKRGILDAALALVSQWANSQPAAIKPGNSDEVSKAVDTLDRVEAYLSYARVEATQRGGATGDGVKEASEAMAALMQRRERMSYLRPASMYLRSALATTGQQADPALEWSNLLAATVKRLFSHKDVDAQKTANVRADLDKSFWQSVNQVRVSAAGDSNFAIAKDDVGNWYVKAMGSDSAAMISAAKNLALYNMGGRIDTNLLRIDELRNKPDRLTNDPDDTELKDLLNRKNGAAASAYGSTLQVFSDNHAKTVKSLLASLDDTLKLQTHFVQLRARWATTYASSQPKLDAVKLALSDPALLTLQDKALTATAAVDPQPVGSTPSSQLLEGLDLVAQQRARIKSLLVQVTLLTKDEVAAAEAQNKVVAEREAQLAVAQAEQTALLQKRAELQEQRDKVPNNLTKPETDALQANLDEKQKQANEKGLLVAGLRGSVLESRATAAKLGQLADGAQALKTRALDDVDAVLQKLVKDIAGKHLRAVEEFETAARVVSQGVQGKAAKQ